MENITDKLLEKIFFLQEEITEKNHENKKLKESLETYKEYVDYLKKKNNTQETKNKNEEIRAFYIGIGLTIILYLLTKFHLWYFF